MSIINSNSILKLGIGFGILWIPDDFPHSIPKINGQLFFSFAVVRETFYSSHHKWYLKLDMICSYNSREFEKHSRKRETKAKSITKFLLVHLNLPPSKNFKVLFVNQAYFIFSLSYLRYSQSPYSWISKWNHQFFLLSILLYQPPQYITNSTLK